MSALSELSKILNSINIPWETGAYTKTAPNEYVVLVPLSDSFDILADNLPQYDIQAVRINIFSKGNYNKIKNKIVQSLLASDFSFMDRRYIDYDSDTGYHQYALDVEKHYEME